MKHLTLLIALLRSCITCITCRRIIALSCVFWAYLVIGHVLPYETKNISVAKKGVTSSVQLLLQKERVLNDKIAMDQFQVENKFTEQTDLKTDTSYQKTFSVMFYCPFQIRFKAFIDSFQPEKCAFSNCKFRRESLCKNDVYPDDAIVFQGNRMPKKTSIPRLNSDQVFVFFNNEPPFYYNRTDLRQKPYRGMFNWTMTYRSDSDIFCPYGRVVRKQNDAVNDEVLLHKNNGHNVVIIDTAVKDNAIFKRKNMSSLWFVSHCNTDSMRESYVKALASVTGVEQYGSCNDNHINDDVAKNMYHKYKFYLSFENSLCTDYMTEKVFNWFDKDVIPVVRNRVKNNQFLPPGTYIDARNFRSATELGLFLNKLASNEEEYMKYLHAQRMYDVVKEQGSAHMAFCDLCEKLNNLDANRKSIPDIHTWWTDKQCV